MTLSLDLVAEVTQGVENKTVYFAVDGVAVANCTASVNSVTASPTAPTISPTAPPTLAPTATPTVNVPASFVHGYPDCEGATDVVQAHLRLNRDAMVGVLTLS